MAPRLGCGGELQDPPGEELWGLTGCGDGVCLFHSSARDAAPSLKPAAWQGGAVALSWEVVVGILLD